MQNHLKDKKMHFKFAHFITNHFVQILPLTQLNT